LFSIAAGVDESVGDVTVAMAMTPILIARISCSNRFMRPFLEHQTRREDMDPSDEGIDDTFLLRRPLGCCAHSPGRQRLMDFFP